MGAEEARPLIDWLLNEGRRITDTRAFLAALADRLWANGIEVSRLVSGVPILHPQVYSHSARWDQGGATSERFFRVTPETMKVLENSPVKTVYEGGGSVRCDPTQPPREGEYNILADLRREGATDYIALSIPFSDGATKLLAVATRHPKGFSDAHIRIFEAMIPAFAANLEIHALRLTARTLLETYVGQQAGARVLDGVIKRGMGETIRAVIWFSDLRHFTDLSEQLPRDAVIELLNEYFGAVCAALDAHGGEVLKFMGDALLAIFPIGIETPAAVCARALAATGKAEAGIADVNERRAKAGLAGIKYGTALHLGDAMYGNIGGERRLDFTVIGPAVNLASRIEGLCRVLDRPVLLSAATRSSSASSRASIARAATSPA
jgi:adenylate cyclase